jgi:hypothetical protein
VVPLAFGGWVQRPPPHTSAVQKFPSSPQGTALLVWTQPIVALHESFVHGFESLQTGGGPA